jgi:hypothetical protein
MDFYLVCKNGNVNTSEKIQYYINNGVDFNVQFNNGKPPYVPHKITPFHYLVQTFPNFDLKTLKYCIEKGNANINIEDSSDSTPFQILCDRNDITLEMLKYAIEECKADINKQDTYYYMSSFHTLCSNVENNNFDLAMLKYCVATGADINQQCISNTTPFYELCSNKYTNKPAILQWIKDNKLVDQTILHELIEGKHNISTMVPISDLDDNYDETLRNLQSLIETP